MNRPFLMLPWTGRDYDGSDGIGHTGPDTYTFYLFANLDPSIIWEIQRRESRATVLNSSRILNVHFVDVCMLCDSCYGEKISIVYCGSIDFPLSFVRGVRLLWVFLGLVSLSAGSGT
jgi:hypothetical protein